MAEEAMLLEAAIEDLSMATVPVEVHLNTMDQISMPPGPAPLAFALPRSSYLFSTLPAVSAAFKPHVADFGMEPNVWFEHDGVVVDWFHPFGVFVDRLMLVKRRIPVVLVARVTSDSPPASLPAVVSKKQRLLRTSHACKQACATMFGETKPFVNLRPDVSTSVAEFGMLTAATKGMRKGFEEGWAAIRQNGARHSSGNPTRYPVQLHWTVGTLQKTKMVPVCLEHFLDIHEGVGNGEGEGEDGGAETPTKVVGEGGSSPTSASPKSPLDSSSATMVVGALTQEQQNSVTLGDVLAKTLGLTLDQVETAMVCGIQGLPPQMPFLWLHSKFTYSDGCLHVMIGGSARTVVGPDVPVAGGSS